MDHELVLENSSTADAYTQANMIIYLEAAKHYHIRLRQIYYMDLELNAVLWL